MITENLTRPPEPAMRAVPKPATQNPIGMLTRIYREVGVPLEAARRCALADFRCNFPQFLGAGV
jgi:hypothetical protein